MKRKLNKRVKRNRYCSNRRFQIQPISKQQLKQTKHTHNSNPFELKMLSPKFNTQQSS